ncbi:hypothetical protein BN174_4270005 [Clostridioides difficile E15]|nr:hypothetical protein BN174_4270005 [Clostridioides difficile E15]
MRQNGLALEFVYKQTLKICKEAVKQNKDAIDFVEIRFLEIDINS